MLGKSSLDAPRHNGLLGPILVFGRSGQIAKALRTLLGNTVICLSREEADFETPEVLPNIIAKIRPTAVINAAAYTQVELAETQEAMATTINSETPGKIAGECARLGIPLVHYSTDYVFGPPLSAPDRPWQENDQPAPLNAYGRSKLSGEALIQEANGKWIILRTSWVYDATGKNFLRTMLRLGTEQENLQVIADQFGAPTYAKHIAAATVQILEQALCAPKFPTGIYNICNSGETTWNGFAKAIFEEARHHTLLKIKNVQEISSSQRPSPMTRPKNSRLDLTKIQKTFGIYMAPWQAALKECLEEIFIK